MDERPAGATEHVEVLPPDPARQRRGDDQRRRLDAALAPWLVAGVEHVGSTAVPGLAAKPVIDLQAAVADLDRAPDVAAALAADGWHLVPPELDGRADRRFLVRVVGGHRSAHLHLMTTAGGRWDAQLAFRDMPRADAGLRDGYATLEHALAAEHADDREACTAAKAEFVRAALDEGPHVRSRPSTPRWTASS